MKKILLIGKLNTVVNETNHFLSQYFHVQICSENAVQTTTVRYTFFS